MIVDAHLHAYRSAEAAREEKGGYPIVEYGAGDGVVWSARDGTVTDALEALAEAGASRAALLEVFTVPGRSRTGGSGPRSPPSPSTP